jgi:hypothetical protein
MTQRLLVQSEEVSRCSEVMWPRFHDLLRIYHMQNMALAGSRSVGGSTDEVHGTSISWAVNMPSVPSQQPQYLHELPGVMNIFSERSQPKDWELLGDASINLLPFQPRAGENLLTKSPTSHNALPSVLPPILSSVEKQPPSLPRIKTVPSISQHEVIHTPTSENRTPQLTPIRPRQGELGKRPHSALDAVSLLMSSLPIALADIQGGRRARTY